MHVYTVTQYIEETMGYKQQSLLQLEAKCLPTLYWESLPVHTLIQNETTASNRISILTREIARVASKFSGHWALRTDEDVRSGSTLPLFGSNRQDTPATGASKTLAVATAHPEYSYILSEAPDDSTRDANIVCWKEGDYLFGEISYQPMTLRDAWVRGKLYGFVITGGPQDFIRNYQTLQPKAQFRLDYLRRLHHLIQDDGYEYEVSVQNNSRIIVWQQLKLTENHNVLMLNLF